MPYSVYAICLAVHKHVLKILH